MSLLRRSTAEFVGTFWLVLGGCGSAVLAAGFPGLGIGFLGVALAFGLTVLTMAAALGPLSGGHFNPAVSIGLCAGGRFPSRDVPAYIVAQVAGGIVAGAVLYLIASRRARVQPGGGICRQRVRRPLARPLRAAGSRALRDGADGRIFDGDHGRDRSVPIGRRVRPHLHRVRADADPPHQHPGDQHLGEPGPQHRRGLFRRAWAVGQLWLFWLAPVVGGALGGYGYKALVDTRRAGIQNRRSTPTSMVGPKDIAEGPQGIAAS